MQDGEGPLSYNKAVAGADGTVFEAGAGGKR